MRSSVRPAREMLCRCWWRCIRKLVQREPTESSPWWSTRNRIVASRHSLNPAVNRSSSRRWLAIQQSVSIIADTYNRSESTIELTHCHRRHQLYGALGHVLPWSLRMHINLAICSFPEIFVISARFREHARRLGLDWIKPWRRHCTPHSIRYDTVQYTLHNFTSP